MTYKLLTPEEISLLYPERPFTPRLPFGFKKKEGDPSTLEADPVLISILHNALDQLDAGMPLRRVREQLNIAVRETGDNSSLSVSGLKLARLTYRPNYTRFYKREAKKLTRPERTIRNRREKIGIEKQKIAAALKRKQRLEDEIAKKRIELVVPERVIDSSLHMELDYGSAEFEQAVQEQEILFKPNPGPQTTFFSASEQEVLYGGAAGGGKSYALIADPMRYFDNGNFRGLILRRTNDELRELISKSHELYGKVFGKKARWSERDKEWKFTSGAKLWMTYLEREDDVHRYQGQAFTYIGFDELTQYPTSRPWEYMRSRLRDASNSLPLFMRATSNPGGPGHGWVKRMFIDPAPYGKAFDARDPDGKVLLVPEGDEDFPREKWGKPLFQRRFIPAKLSDNPYLSKGGQYKGNLLSLPDHLQRQLLDGDWDVAEGAAFPEFRSKLHVIEPFEIPGNWRRFRSCDFGYSERQSSAVHWYAINPSTDQLVVYREFYKNKLTGQELAREILKLEAGENVSYGVLDSSVWAVRGQSGPSIAEEMIRTGCRWRPSDRSKGSRVAGRNRLHQLLRLDPVNNEPGIVFFNTCRQIISDLPVIPNDKDSDDIDPDYATDHAYDSIRYGIMTRPRAYSPYDEWEKVPKAKPLQRPADMTFGY